MNSTTFHVIKDPVHGTMQFTSIEDNWVKPFIDHPAFQRLRHIKQLGLGDFIFPGAVHTRFNHSLGCCYVGSQIAHKIGLADEERQLVMIACLLHDIGHGPFSHACEDIFQQKSIRHEDWTPYFLAEFRQKNFFDEYNKLNPRYHLTEEKFNTIEGMIMHNPVTRGVLADIVSSQLDADRLDYLLRDSHFCGVVYGQFDFRWMLHCMAIIETEKGERLGMTHKGIGGIEHYLMARRLMTRNIYHGQKKLALEFFLVQFLATLASSLATSSLNADLRQTRLGQFLLAVDQFNQENSTALHKKQFLENNYKIYRELCDYDVFALIKQLVEIGGEGTATKIATRLHYRVMPEIIRLDHMDIVQVKEDLQEFKMKHQKEIEDWQLALIQTPHQAYSAQEDPILVVNERGKIEPINEMSMMIQAISEKREQVAFLCVDKVLLEDNKVRQLLAKW